MAINNLVSVDATGFHYPDFPTLLDALKTEYRNIYGSDVYLEADSQDGQWVGILALAMFDCIQVAAAVYNSFSPLTAQSDALSRQVKINGLERHTATYSNSNILITGGYGTDLANITIEDNNGHKWDIAEGFTIPVAGYCTRTAVCRDLGAIAAQANTITKIVTPVRGWTSATNVAAANEGHPIETDAELRMRQTLSTMIPSLGVMDGIVGAVAEIEGVTRLRGYENDTGSTDSNGIPAHSIAIVAEGGDQQHIGEAIWKKKTAGTGTFGGEDVTVSDRHGIDTVVHFIRPTDVSIQVLVEVTPLTGFIDDTLVQIADAIAAYINGLQIGEKIVVNRLFTPANLGNVGVGATYFVDLIEIGQNDVATSGANIDLDFDAIAVCVAADDVTVNVP